MSTTFHPPPALALALARLPATTRPTTQPLHLPVQDMARASCATRVQKVLRRCVREQEIASRRVRLGDPVVARSGARITVGIALAAPGLQSPMLAGAATAFGRVSVANVLLLRHWKGSASW